eukprot:scaffold2422_cov171-Amphora_coffeaeformis.AAC.7
MSLSDIDTTLDTSRKGSVKESSTRMNKIHFLGMEKCSRGWDIVMLRDDDCWQEGRQEGRQAGRDEK